MAMRLTTIVFLFGWLAAQAFHLGPLRQGLRVSSDRVVSSVTSLHVTSVEGVNSELEYEVPEDAVIIVKPKAMKRLRELKDQQKAENLVLRMGVRNGGCSGMSYVMDFSTMDAVEEDDAIDKYDDGSIVCVVDAKSMLYLYGLELDFSEELIGGGFKFFNPNAEESCGCGSSFGI